MQTKTFSLNGNRSTHSFRHFFEDKRQIIETINDNLQFIGNKKLMDASAHLFSAGGKMLRSSLVTTCYKAVGGKDIQKILPVAAAVELVHNWSLVHDDIIDNSLTRRGVVTVHNQWNANTAILTGDAMSNLVYLLIARSSFDTQAIVKVSEHIAQANLSLIDGELMDIEFETRNDVTEKEYFEMIEKKTGALLKSAAVIGATLGTSNQKFIEAISSYGEKIGTAFQIKDDLLDLTGDEEETGKDFAGDIREGKKTVMLLHALRNTSGEKSKRLKQITSGAAITVEEIHEAIDIMDEAGSLNYAGNILTRLIEDAKESLAALPSSDYVSALFNLAEFISQPGLIKAEQPLYTI